ncbi:MAG: glycosyltransferase family 2 protein [Rhodothalassiaceae bacterium]
MTRQQAPVSVIMSTFNREAYIRAAVDSLLCQTRPPKQILVINDGSTDATKAILDSYGSRLEVMHQDNSGKSGALNRLMPRISQDYVWVFDDDDVAFPTFVETHLTALAKSPEAAFTYAPVTRALSRPDGTLEPEFVRRIPVTQPCDLLPRLLERCWLLQQAMLVRTAAFLSVGGYDSTLLHSEDYDFLLKLARTHSGIHIDEPALYWRQHGGHRGAAGSRIPARQRREKWYLANQAIFRNVRRDFALWEYLPHTPPSPQPDRFDQVAALRSRYKVMALHGLWDLALDDLAQLVQQAQGTGADAALTAVLTASLTEPLAVESLLSNKGYRKRFAEAIHALCTRPQRRVISKQIYYALLKNWSDISIKRRFYYVRTIGKFLMPRLTVSRSRQQAAGLGGRRP